MDENGFLISAPPPPPEVKMRTMRSDLAAMAKSGGGVPRFESVKVAGWVPAGGGFGQRAPDAAGAPGASGALGSAGSAKRRNMTIVLIVVAAVAAAALIGYFVYVAFFSGGNNSPAEQSGAGPSAASAGTGGSSTATAASAGAATTAPAATAPAAAAPAGPFTHKSLFREPADQTLILTLSSGGAAQTAADLESFNQKLTVLLPQVKKGAALIEVGMVGADGNGVAVGDVLTEENAAVLDPQFLAAHFNPDATFFLYRDASGVFWPGYVIALSPGENWLYLQSDVAKLESSPSIANFFLVNVGASAAGGFTDATVSSTPVRVLSYPNASPPASFLYGWHNADLILSTSQAGFMQALAHL